MAEPVQSVASAPSVRVRLAMLARDAALTTPGVAGLDAGVTGNFVTVGGGERVPGVRCAAAPDGGFDLSLRLVCEFVPLRPVAEWVRREIESAAQRGGFELETVTVGVTDVLDPAAA